MGRGLQGRAKLLRLGGGSACPGERLEPAVELVEKGDIDYIILPTRCRKARCWLSSGRR